MSRKPTKPRRRTSETRARRLPATVVERAASMGGFVLDPRGKRPDAKMLGELVRAVKKAAIERREERKKKGFDKLDEAHRAKIRAIWNEWGARDAAKASELLSEEYDRYSTESKAAGDNCTYADFKREMRVLNRARAGEDPLA